MTNETVITRNMTIYAQWRIQQEIETCTVEFNGNGGSVTPARVTIEKGKAIQLPNPVRSGYDFKGWYTEKEGGTQITNATTFDKDMVVYARWAAKSNVTPEEKRLKKGETFTTGGFKYKVKTPETKAGEGKVALLGYAKSSKAKSLKVKDLVMASETKESYKVTEIAANAFKGNKNLRTVTLGKNIVTLGKNAFSKCKALKKLIIGKNVTTIGNKTFYGCSKLSRITIKSTKLKKVGNKAIAKIKKNAYIKAVSYTHLIAVGGQIVEKVVDTARFGVVDEGSASTKTIRIPKSYYVEYYHGPEYTMEDNGAYIDKGGHMENTEYWPDNPLTKSENWTEVQ